MYSMPVSNGWSSLYFHYYVYFNIADDILIQLGGSRSDKPMRRTDSADSFTRIDCDQVRISHNMKRIEL